MTVSDAQEMWSRRGGGYSTDGKSIKAQFTTAYFMTHTADATDDEILGYTSVPHVGDLFGSGVGVICTETSYEKLSPIASVLTARWSGEVGNDADPNNAPLLKAPDWQWSNLKTIEPIDEDADGIPFCATTGEPLEGFTKEVSDFQLVVNRNFQSINTYLLSQYLDSTNSDPFGSPDSIWPVGTCTLDDFTASIQGNNLNANSVPYYAVTARFLFRIPYRTVAARAWYHRYRNEGYMEMARTNVSFSGGGGSGAAAYAVVASGAISAICVTNYGRDYTSAPTVNITSTTGSGASATATVSNGRVLSVSVGAGGSNYKNGLIRALDDNKEPTSRPVLLKADGSRERNASNAIWLERKKKVYSLPYNALGLF